MAVPQQDSFLSRRAQREPSNSPLSSLSLVGTVITHVPPVASLQMTQPPAWLPVPSRPWTVQLATHCVGLSLLL